ncbi:MAG: GNAT family N-acetyltransferase [Candidatus Eremiobacteraeota bacterium]|nr:GNAT family N-acetyltransferase [Candidatus Eremiobacteraeota bacterium]
MTTLATKRLLLEPVTPRNASVLWSLMQNAHLREFQDIPRYTRVEFERRVAQRPKRLHQRASGRFEWLLSLSDTRVAIGWVSLRMGEGAPGMGEIGYSVLAGYRGRGFASEAARAVVEVGFTQASLRRIDACCVPENVASRRLLARLGFAQAKLQKRGAIVRGRPVDVVVFECERARWGAGAQNGSANSMVMPASGKAK